jgi:putative pyruvate formate lyase activating enzyme
VSAVRENKAQFVIQDFRPAYRALSSADWRTRVDAAIRSLAACRVCPRDCGVNRLADEVGMCRIGRHARVSSAFPHHGEERCLRGWGGSGTIFFAGCNLRCVFCQNFDISQQVTGRTYPANRIADMMLALQEAGCHNINFVTPEHVVPQMLEATALAVERGLCVPIVYNTSAYDSVETLRILDGIVDIYMPDFKLWSEAAGARYLGAADYGARAREAIAEMHRQVGDLRFTPDGIACRGVLVRHLVMPGLVSESVAILRWLAELSRDMYVNLMDQYHPDNRVGRTEFPEINRRVTDEELAQAFAAARAAGLWRFD